MQTKDISGKEYFVPELEDVLNAKVIGDDHVVEDWPWGSKKRCSMHFFVERHPKRGERFVKQSTMNGRTYKPKASTYAKGIVIVEIDGFIGHITLTQYGFCGVDIENGKYLSQTFHDADGVRIYNHFFKDEAWKGMVE